MLTVSDDGYIRLTRTELQTIALHHLISGLDDDPCQPHQAASPTHITGYTEWVSHTTPALSLGWDWQLGEPTDPQGIVRISEVRSNLVLINDTPHNTTNNNTPPDASEAQNETWLANHLKTLDWQTTVKAFITQRYQ